jgi:RNA polymerase sigma-70 factor (ECF subfamily)
MADIAVGTVEGSMALGLQWTADRQIWINGAGVREPMDSQPILRLQDYQDNMTPPAKADDRALMERLRAKDQHALAALYERYSRPVFNLALYVLQHRGQAEEITQDVFVLIWRSPEKWRPEKGQLGSWLMAVTRYLAIDRLRKENSRPTGSALSLDDDATRLSERLEISVSPSAQDDAQLLRTLLARLPKEQVQVLVLAYFRGLTHDEIARRLNIPPGTVKSRIRLGLEKLREWWREAVKE